MTTISKKQKISKAERIIKSNSLTNKQINELNRDVIDSLSNRRGVLINFINSLKVFTPKEHNVFQFTNKYFSSQYTKHNGFWYFRNEVIFNHKPSWGKWTKTNKTELEYPKDELTSCYINVRIKD